MPIVAHNITSMPIMHHSYVWGDHYAILNLFFLYNKISEAKMGLIMKTLLFNYTCDVVMTVRFACDVVMTTHVM